MRRRKSDQRNVDIVIDLPTKVWWSTEIRIWGLAAAAVLGIVSFAATWAQTRWQAELSQQKDETSKRERLQAEERIAAAQADAARASEQAALAAERTAEMRAKNLALEAALSPRWMEQNLSALALHNFAGTMYDVASPNDFEPKRTASQIKFMLKQAGWTRTPLPDPIIFLDGITVRINAFPVPRAGSDQTTIAAADALAWISTARNSDNTSLR